MKEFIEELIYFLEHNQNLYVSGNEALYAMCIAATGSADPGDMLYDLVVVFDQSSWEEVFDAARRQAVDEALLAKLQALVKERGDDYRRGQRGIEAYVYD